MVAVGVGHDVDWMELRGLASYPQSATVFHARSQNDLPGLVEDLVNTTCDGLLRHQIQCTYRPLRYERVYLPLC